MIYVKYKLSIYRVILKADPFPKAPQRRNHQEYSALPQSWLILDPIEQVSIIFPFLFLQGCCQSKTQYPGPDS